ncbi:unnamed protein product [Trichogramma brassicae]|uniref:Uncharacterized protein n=1 Tax=Trichogramma brassicae TaxID=86971 RepID=A0A6H5ITK6_9HYME|nr:unnamed protein product [Trichogramma brassicae]
MSHDRVPIERKVACVARHTSIELHCHLSELRLQRAASRAFGRPHGRISHTSTASMIDKHRNLHLNYIKIIAYIETLLNYNDDAKKLHLTASLWYADDSGRFEAAPQERENDELNSGAVPRQSKAKEHIPKKAMTFTTEDINRFLSDAPDQKHLLHKELDVTPAYVQRMKELDDHRYIRPSWDTNTAPPYEREWPSNVFNISPPTSPASQSIKMDETPFLSKNEVISKIVSPASSTGRIRVRRIEELLSSNVEVFDFVDNPSKEYASVELCTKKRKAISVSKDLTGVIDSKFQVGEKSFSVKKKGLSLTSYEEDRQKLNHRMDTYVKEKIPKDYCGKPRGFIKNQRGFSRKSSWINRESTRIYAEILVDRSRINEDFRANPRGLRTWTLYLIHVRSTWNQCPILEESLYDPRGISVDDPRGYPRNFFQLVHVEVTRHQCCFITLLIIITLINTFISCIISTVISKDFNN